MPMKQPGDRRAEILDIATRLFRRTGYRETTIRDIAAAVGVKSASLYYHFANKDAILVAIAQRLMEDFVAEVTPLLAGGDPEAAVAAAVDAHLRFDLARLDDVLVSAHERRSLPPPEQREINDLRRRHRDALSAAIEAGAARGVFADGDPDLRANAVLDLLGGVKEWFRPSTATEIDLMVARYQRFVRDLLGHGAQNGSRCATP